MDTTEELPPQLSQASSHFPLEPISGSTLFEMEITRRDGLRCRGTLGTGCREVDEQALVHGLDRGSVVGVSGEEVEMGLLIGLQTIAHTLVFGSGTKTARPRAAIITTLAAPAILPMLRDVIRSQVQAKLGKANVGVDAQVRQCLEGISISRVFDVEGLWEVLNEIETPPQGPTTQEAQEADDEVPPATEQADSSPLSSPPPSPAMELPPLRTTKTVGKTEILDSEDEDGLSSPPASSSPHPPRPIPPVIEQPEEETAPAGHRTPSNPPNEAPPNIPDIILITHFYALLSTLFNQREKSSAHTTLQLLSSHLRYLSRTSGPLIMILNNTTNHPSAASLTSNNNNSGPLATTGVQSDRRSSERPVDPTLRSIFNPPPPTHAGYYGATGLALSKKNKPAFGLIFSQFLDLHLLCTMVPKSRADAEAVFVAAGGASSVSAGGGAKTARYAWVVEVLLDENGCWETGPDGQGGRRIDREQRWAAVEIKDGIRVVDAFEKPGGGPRTYNKMEPIQVAAGFGGRRV